MRSHRKRTAASFLPVRGRGPELQFLASAADGRTRRTRARDATKLSHYPFEYFQQLYPRLIKRKIRRYLIF